MRGVVRDVNGQRSATWAVTELSDTHFPNAKKIVLVQDNLNTHKPASLYEAFPPAEPENEAGGGGQADNSRASKGGDLYASPTAWLNPNWVACRRSASTSVSRINRR